MMKKKNSLICIAGMLLVLSCTKNLSGTDAPVPVRRYPLTVSLPQGLCGRAGTASSDTQPRVEDLTVVVYDARSGLLDAVQTVSGASSVTLSCTAGDKRIHALVNCAGTFARPFVREGDEADRRLSLDFSPDAPPLSGMLSVRLPAATPVEVPVSRDVARVVLHRIRFDLGPYDAASAAVPPVLRAVYLINIPCSSRAGIPDGWLLGKWWLTASNGLAYLSLSLPLVPGQERYDTPHCLYALPHDRGLHTSRLVVELSLMGTTLYYPVSLPPLQANRSYELDELLITRAGSDDPDKPIVPCDQGFSIEIKGWDSVAITDGIDF